MTHLYYIIVIILTGLASSIVTMYLPSFKRAYKRIIQRFKRKSPSSAIDELTARINALETKIKNKDEYMAKKVRAEVKKYLEELAK